MWIIQFKLREPFERVLKAKLCFLSAQEILVEGSINLILVLLQNTIERHHLVELHNTLPSDISPKLLSDVI